MTIQKFFPFTVALKSCKDSSGVPKLPVNEEKGSFFEYCISTKFKQQQQQICFTM